MGVNSDGRRALLGLEIGGSQAEPFWTEFLRNLKRRGLKGVKLVTSDSHEGLKAAAAKDQWRSVADQLRPKVPKLAALMVGAEVGIFPNDAAARRLIGAILPEQNNEWAIQPARYINLETIGTSLGP